MAQRTGKLTTYHADTDSRVIRDVDDKIAYYDPNVAPLITMLNRVGRRKGVSAQHVEWYEKDYVARWSVTTAGVDANAGSTTVPVDDGTKFVAGDCFIVAPDPTSSTKPEMCRVVSVATNDLTVVRAVGGNLAAIPNTGGLRLIGPMFEEFSAFPTPKHSIPSKKDAYLQISRTPTSFSKSAELVAVYGVKSNDRDQAHIEKMREHKEKMNATLLWGVPSQDTSGGPSGYPIRSSMGLYNTITSNVMDASGVLTLKKFQEWSRMVFRYGPKRKILVASPVLKEAIDAWGHSRLNVSNERASKKLLVSFNTVETAHGTFAVVKDWMLENDAAGSYGFGNMGIAVDLDMITYLYLQKANKSRDTKVYMDAIKNGEDGHYDEILTEYGFRIKLENHFGIIYNITDYMQ